jgi:hypothetical protein
MTEPAGTEQLVPGGVDGPVESTFPRYLFLELTKYGLLGTFLMPESRLVVTDGKESIQFQKQGATEDTIARL